MHDRVYVAPHLHHEVPQQPVEDHALVVAILDQPNEVLARARRRIDVQLQVDVAVRGLQLRVALRLLRLEKGVPEGGAPRKLSSVVARTKW